MNNDLITTNDMRKFKSLSFKQVCDSMGLYLIGTSVETYNMKDVERMVFGAENLGYTVSLIHRVYNFAGQNKGRYKKGCAFEKKYGYQVTTADTIAFVQTYPNGCAGTSITFEQFLTSRVNNARNKQTVTNQKTVQQQTAANQKPVQQNKQQQSWYDSLQANVTPQYSNPAPVAAPSQLTIGELCRLSPQELTPQQLATLKAAGYEYVQIIKSWRSPEQIAEDNASSEYHDRKEAEEKAKREYDAKMAAAGYVKVGNVFDGYQWISQEEAWLKAAATLAMEKGRLAEHVMEQVNTGELEFDVVLLGHITPGYTPQHTISFEAMMTKKHKHLTFLPDKKIPMLMTYPSFNLLHTTTYRDDITNVNSVYLIPHGYRIVKVTFRGKLPARPDLPDAMLVTLTCEDLRNVNNASAQCPQCGTVNMPGSIFCSKCGRMLG